MSVELPTANKEVMNLLKSVWEADPISTGIQIVWDDVEANTPTDTDISWIRATIVTGTSTRTGIGTKARLYDRNGILVVQLFTNISSGLLFKDNLVNILSKGFEGATTSSGVRFEDFKFTNHPEAGGGWHLRNVTINFTYETSN